MTPTPSFHAYPILFLPLRHSKTLRTFESRGRSEKVCQDNRFTIRLGINMSRKVHSHLDSKISFSIPSNRLSNLQSCWDYLVATSTWSYTKLMGISFPSDPRGPTRAI